VAFQLWLVAGVNGAGKTTLTRRGPLDSVLGPLLVLNPDERTEALRAASPLERLDALNLRAAIEIGAQVDDLIAAGSDLLVETVLSSNKYLATVRKAKSRGYRIGMIYVALASVDLSIARVKTRVAGGGHDVPEAKLRSRWARSLDNLVAFYPLLDELYVFDNSSAEGDAVLVAEKVDGRLELLEPEELPEITRRLQPLVALP
jgi:predicted ABC-type ATPase